MTSAMGSSDSGSVRFDLGIGADATTRMGDYEFDWSSKLGEGAYGSVYRGCNTESGTLVAVKVVSSHRVKEDELESISKAQSSCVVRLLDVLKNESLTYIVMELCDTDLSAFLNSYGKLSEQNLTVLARCLAEGYLVLHRHGIVHRDIKPQNILLKLESASGSETCQTSASTLANGDTCSSSKHSRRPTQPLIIAAKFADFGCSRVRKDRNGEDEPANCAGTFFYMAPEVGANLVNSHRYDEAVDMWSIGVVLFQAMTGRVPFTEQQLCRLFLRAVDQNYTAYMPPSVEEEPEDVPPPERNKPAEPKRRSIKCKTYHCYQHHQEIIHRLLQLDPSARLNPLQFHSYAAHDRPSTFIRCLNEGSCSSLQTTSASAAAKKLSSSVSSVRRTASGVFSRLRDAVSGCNARV